MGMEILTLTFRLRARFGVDIGPDELRKLFHRHDPSDLSVGELLEFIRGKIPDVGVLDFETDADDIWRLFRQEISIASGVDEEEITKEGFLIRDLGMG